MSNVGDPAREARDKALEVAHAYEIYERALREKGTR